MKDAYFYLSSSSGLDINPQNSVSNFRVQLPQTLRLDPSFKWSVAILDIDLPKFDEEYHAKYITIESGICTSSGYKNGLRPVLQRLYFDDVKKGRPINITNPRYVALNKTNIDSVDFLITDNRDNKPPFKQGSVECTLHISRDEEEEEAY